MAKTNLDVKQFTKFVKSVIFEELIVKKNTNAQNFSVRQVSYRLNNEVNDKFI